MSNFEDLIKKHCPDGVEYKTLEDVCIIYTGEQLNRKNMIKEGYPVINGGIQASGYTNNFNEYEETITISQGGASAGFVNFMLEKFWAGAHCYIIKPNTDKLINKYLFFVLKNIEIHIMELKNGAGIPGINKNKITKIKIPLPPIEVQKEIVRILDIFTKYQDLLNRELELRKKQYEYYRGKLLTFGEDVEWKYLGEIGRVAMCKRVMKAETEKEGDIPFYKIGTFGKKADAFISRELFEEYRNKYSFPKKGDILISASGTIGRTVIYDGEPAYYQDSNIVWLEHDESIILNKYLFYCYQLKPWNITSGGTIQRLYNDNIRNAKIPVPPLEEQERIVKILDQFDTLCNDITRGLPAEIELRKKQYEYYRDKLLTFKEKKK